MKRWMNADEDMKKRMNSIRFLVVMFALMFGAVSGAWAQLTENDVEIEVKPNASAGNIEKSVDATTREVTLTVTPAAGYYIKASDIVVEKLVNTGKANAPKRRTPSITDVITGKLYSGSGRTDADIISSVENPNSAQYVFTLPADYDGAYVTATFTSLTSGGVIRITRSTSLGSTPDMNAHYILVDDVSAAVLANLYSATPFTGIFEGESKADGSFPTISGLTHALFQTVDGGTVKNIVLDNVTISGSTTVTVGGQSKTATGAIANVATGASRIYNCGIQATGSSVTTDKDGYTLFSTANDAEGNPQHTESSSTVGGVDYVGGLVGFLDGTARVINCYSYADITSGSVVGGIVGRNNVATTASNLNTMVMNCMFYGNLTSTSENKAPIYNGVIITNRSDQSGVSNFNYFWAGAPYVQIRNNINTYNCALTAETRYLQRFEFFRHLLNGHRELAAWWVQGDGFEKDEMAKWVMEPSQIGTTTPYPILKSQGKYPSVVNYKPSDETIDANNEHYNEGRKLGTLSVTIRMGSNSPYNAPSGARLKSGQSMTLTLPITDKDPAHFNFNYGKVQLPYYNDYGIGNYTGNRVVTGWKIVSISGGTHGFSTGDDATASVNDNGDITLTTPYNFADRKCTDKDKFEVSGRVFSQGAYFDVPEGVSSIIIEPYWAKAVFVADDYRDVVCNQAMNAKSGIGTVGGGQWFDVGSGKNVSHDFTFAGEGTLTLTVHNTIANAVATLFSGESTAEKKVYDYAVVLVGNVHNLDISNKEKTKPYTIMSIDLDKDNEPDYSYILRFNSRVRVHPVRVDFLNIPGLGMAQKSTGGTGTYNFGIMQTYGWFESTNTSLFRVTQFEYDYVNSNSSGSNREDSPMILQGGVIEQWVTVGGAEDNHKEAKSVTYYHVGGNVWFKEFHIGVHQDKNNSNNKDQFVSKHPPISVTGGDYNEFYLTGLYNTPSNNYDDNAECYINGGRFNKVAGTGMQGIGNLSTHENGNITWQIDNADINEFYGGGINAAHISEGNIMTVISNSRVDQFCGGPKFGNMNGDKKVATNATNCIFRTFFGAGYGGNSYNRRYPNNQNNKININWNTWVQGNDGLKYRYDSNYGGVETRIDYQFLPMSSNVDNVCRLFVDYVSFSLATTHDVTSKLTDCTITTSPLGSLELFSQSVGNFYGGGNLGMVDGPVKSTLTNCTVEGNVFGGGYSATLPTVAVMNNSFQTEPYYDSNLGAYLDAELPTTVPYTWEHATEAEFSSKQIDTDNHILYTTETLTGLGAVTGNVTLTIDGNTTLTNGKRMSVSHSVYGGGEESNVEGNTQVNITGGTITENVFGGGKGEADEFSCSKAMIGVNDAGKCEDPGSEANKDKGTTVTISNGQVNGNVYGGGEVGRVEWNTQVTIGAVSGEGTPVIEGSVFGAGKGKETHGYAALVRGNSTVTIQGNAKVKTNVYGGGEQSTVGRYWVKGIPTTLCENDENETAIPPAPEGLPNEMPYKTRRGGKSTVIIQGSAQIGPDDGATETAGHVFGAGKGVTPAYNYNSEEAGDANKRALWSKRMVDYNSTKHTGEPGTTWDYYEAYTEDQIADTNFPKYVWEYFVDDADPTAANYKSGEDKYLEFLQTLALVTGTDVTIDGGGTVKGNVYGGSESGFVQDDTNVKIQGDNCKVGTTAYGNVFGGGKGLPTFAEAGKVKGTTTVEVSAGDVYGNVYGGGELGDVGLITKPADYNYTWNQSEDNIANTLHNNTITGTNNNTGICTVTISGGTIGVDNPTDPTEHGNVFGAGKGEGTTFWCEKAIAYATNVSVSGGTVKGNVYGGGQVGRVEDDAKVSIGGATEGTRADIKGSVFGAGAGLATHGYSALVRGNTKVTVEGYAKVAKSVYGGGETASVGRYGLNAQKMPNILVGGGECELIVQGNAEIGENVFGACKGVTPAYNNTQGNDNRSKRMVTYDPYNETTQKGRHKQTEKGSFWDPYDDPDNPVFVWEYFTSSEAYLSYLETLALATHPDVTIDGNATVNGSVFGGGELGLTKGSVIVNVQGGTVEEDVYGGGALADTNTTEKVANNYPTTKPDTDTNGDIVTKEVFPTTTVNLLGGIIKGDAYGGGLGRLAADGVEGVHYTQDEIDAAQEGDDAYGKTTKEWKVSPVAAVTAVPATVHGDISVNLGSSAEGSSATGFYITTYSGNHSDVIKSGRIFGCNNLNGSPQGNVRVTVWKTVTGNTGRTAVGNLKIATATHSYNVAAVYGGGNLANYAPTKTGKKASVRIETCDVSIESVYGGGNAAEVPETNVLVRGAYEINEVFGGGNGKDPYTLNGTDWIPNAGANVNSNATTLLTGGLVHGAYGGSNKRGTIYGNVSIDTGTGSAEDNSTNAGCRLDVEKLVGAGKDADVNGDLIMVMGCKPDEKIPVVYAGADNANVNGDVMLTITSGKFGKVFGGNNAGGYILGRIRLNIEETADCNPAVPIEIDELYLGGNEAEYSMYGYYNNGTDTEPVYEPRTAAMAAITDQDAQGYTPAVTTMAGMVVRKMPPYDKPELNIISCTRIGKVYGGGFGAGATLYGDPIVNINMIPGVFANNSTKGVPAKMTELGLPSSDNSDKLGIIGDVFGGGNAAKIEGSTTVNIGTAATVNLTSIPDDDTTEDDESLATVKGAYIVGNVYGGGNEADVTGNTFVNICVKKETDGTYTSVAFAGASGVKITSKTVDGEKVGGNVFGGGKGKADTFTCEKAMIGTNNKGLESNYTDGNTSVIIGNGTVNGSVYGGGEIGRVEMNTTVMIGLEEDTQEGGSGNSAPEINGNVFGAGKGLETHGYAALVRGNPTVTIQGDAKVLHSVYGGGEIASVARYDLSGGAPVALAQINGRYSGYCNVTVQGNAEIGPDGMRMYHADNEGNIAATDKPDDYGHVFAAGKGILPTVYDYVKPATNNQANYHIEGGYDIDQHMPKRMAFYKDKKSAYWEYADPDFNPTGVGEDDLATQNVWEYYSSEEEYFAFIATLALATRTELTIGGKAFVKGSVYGGSENGLVQYDTNVTIQDHCQIGQGKEITTRYEDYTGGNLFELTAPPIKSGSGSDAVYYDLECASWDYDSSSGAPYDPNAKYQHNGKYYYDTDHTKYAEGGSIVGKDGHTYYGNVFGGGSGSVPYFDTQKKESRYIMSAGWVKGDTYVTINGGHILTNVYGGNEATNVDGTAHVTMTDGTIGVPRTLAQIDAHPVTCYLFGAGKGDQRVFFNKDTNVKDAVVNITGGRIYGSVFGGGEDGHVLRNVTMTIGQQTTTGEGDEAVTTTSGPTIGNWGTSYVDGNVFGGGRGFGGDAYTAGNVAGSITMEIIDGRIYGSIYGGGRLGSVGYGLFDATTNNQPTPGYGTMRDDADTEAGFTDGTTGFFTNGRGHIDITISGGMIGNDYEYKIPNATNIEEANITETDISEWTSEDWATWKAYHHIPKTEFDASGHLTHTKGGNVFAGGMGRFHKLDGTYISAIDWWKLGCVKSTKLTITGGTIKSNVYGGGELGQVVGHHTTQNAANENINASTEIIIQGSNTQIGTEVKNGGTTEYTFGSVFGGGYGSLVEEIGSSNPKFIAGLVKEDTKIDMQNGAVKASIYGGGEMASVGESTTSEGTTTATGSTYVAVSGGTVGIEPITVSNSKRYFGGAKMGNVYGGGSGHNNTVRSGRILKNTNVTISGSDTRIYHNIYGGGAYGTVGDFDYSTGSDGKVTAVNGLATTGTGVANVTITGGIIGYDGRENGMVFGSSRGDINRPGERDDHTAWVNDTYVNIGTAATGTPGQQGYVAATGPTIKGTVYGSGENGHVFNNTVVTVNGGIIGIESGSDITYTEDGQSVTKGGAAYPYRGNVYGGGCGTDKYYSDHAQETHDGNGQLFNPLAGIVYGTTTVNINGGTVVRNVYGAGAMGSVGRTVTTTENNTTTTTYSGGSTTINVSDGIIGVSGTVGDGNVFGAARGDLSATGDYISQVRGTSVTVSGGVVKGNVYGGGELGDVGTIDKSDQTDYNYYWTDKNGRGNIHGNNRITGTNNNTGICTVTVSGGTIGTDATTMNADGSFDNGNVFGGGKGSGSTWWCEKAIAYGTNVTVTGGTVKGSVYGGGEVGRVEDDSKVTIGSAPNDAPTINGSVFGAGKGLKTHGYSALVRGNAEVIVQGKSVVEGSVYGGGEIASVGKFVVDKGLPKKPKNGGTCTVLIQDEAKIGSSGSGHNVFGACKGVKSVYDGSGDNYKNFKSMQTETNGAIGTKGTDWDYYKSYPDGYAGHKFVWKYYKTEDAYLAFLKTLALTSNTHVTIDGDATVYGSVFGGGERGVTLGGVDVNITGGTVNEDVYGGGSLADSNAAMWDAEHNQRVNWVELEDLIAGTPATGYYTTESADALITASNATVQANTTYYANYKTNVNLKDGTVNRNVYGGGLGQLAKAAVTAIDAVLYTDVDEFNTDKGTSLTADEFEALSDAEKTKTPAVEAQDAMSAVEAKVYGDVLVKLNEDTDNDKCEVKGTIFGCNNLNGSPQNNVTVHVYKTVRKNDSGEVMSKPTPKNDTTYEMTAVYGGGNLAAYYPDDETARASAIANVIIDGCELTSIGSVYGGGNAASVPATDVVVNGTYEIGEVFGGGNGKDKVSYDGGVTYVDNPGANVGLLAYPNASNDAYDTKENRENNYGYGIGKAHATIYGGTVHTVYGGSNKKGNVRIESRTTLEDGECSFNVGAAYGGGNDAPMDGDAVLEVGCISGMEKAYGGAANADVNGDVTLNITNGTYSRVFGGNDQGGAIRGSITVNIEETGCRPIVIGELYGGGNEAAYSVYGYDADGKPLKKGDPGALDVPNANPTVNVKSFTSIGTIYGGGYGTPATMVGSPIVNINVHEGKYYNTFRGNDNVIDSNAKVVGTSVKYLTTDPGYDKGYPVPSHEKGKIGAINNVFGGGNAAAVIGNPTLNIGTEAGEEVYAEVEVKTGTSVENYYTRTEAGYTAATGDAVAGTTYYLKTSKAVDIRGNVYGGGNNADVQGDTNVVIGKKAE